MILCEMLLIGPIGTHDVHAQTNSSITSHRPTPEHHPSRILVRFKTRSIASANPVTEILPDARQIHSYTIIENLKAIEVHPDSLEQSLQQLRNSRDVLYAEYDFVVHAGAFPNDPMFDQQWGLFNTGQTINGDPGIPNSDIRALNAWDYWSGSSVVKIAILDTGVDYTHPDLADNIWTNKVDNTFNNSDEDRNGFMDDVHGYNTLSDNGDTLDDNGHGTHVAGIIGAVGNNLIGVTGVAQRCQIVALKFLDSEGNGFISDAIKALEYVLDQEIKISNNSWGCVDCFSQALYDTLVIAQNKGHLMIASAGNGILGLGVDNEQFPFYPASYDLPNILSVAACNNNDTKPKFSSFGLFSVDLAAPGETILSTAANGGYEFRSGTSMASAYVSGVATVLLSRQPDYEWYKLKEHILYSTRPVNAFVDITTTGGVLNMLGAIADCNDNQSLDEEDIASGISVDCNQNDVPDECEPDCNNNDISDLCDIASNPASDCDQNLSPDECDIDCDQNGQADACDITQEIHQDCNNNGIPDLCEPRSNADCNRNSIPDLCDLYLENSFDCNLNGVPDECDIASLRSEDCTGNGLPDECERDCNGNQIADSCDIQNGVSQDQNQDRIPDECSLGLSLVPVGANNPFVIEGTTIQVTQGESTIVLEVQLTGWDPDQDGQPRIRAYQVGLDPVGLTSGKSGSISVTRLPCINNEDCLVDSLCLQDNLCDLSGGFNIDEFHPNYIFGSHPSIIISDPNTLRLGGLVFELQHSAFDNGIARYIGTVTFDVSPDATGVFTIGFDPYNTVFVDQDGSEDTIILPGMIPARIQISPDCNNNRVPDSLDISSGSSDDCDHDLVPDDCVSIIRDCNLNRIPDSCEIENNTSLDCNRNGILDSCMHLESDCNNNNIPDLCDTLNETSEDCNANGIPDECIRLESDCNENNIPDACDINDGTSRDCNNNNKPDVCDKDCNNNGTADECDIAEQTSRDRDQNNIPDECQRLLIIPDQYADIQSAINESLDGDVILVSEGTYSGPGNVEIDFLGKSITVRGEGGAERCVLDAAGSPSVFHLKNRESNHSRINGFTIKNASHAGIICLGSSPTIRNCIIENNGPGAGGILATLDSNPLIENSIIRDNFSAFSGGGIRCIDRSSPTIIGCKILNNQAIDFGGGVYVVGGDPVISHCTISNNYAIDGGGGIALRDSFATVINSTISGNLTGPPLSVLIGDGGGIYAINTNGSISGCVITGNVAHHRGGGLFVTGGGGGLFVTGDKPEFTNCTIAHNTAELQGGGLFWMGSTDRQIACCISDSCIDTFTDDQCMNIFGAIYPGLTCDEVNCGTRACCLPDESCQNLSFFSCLSADGISQEAGSQCINFSCVPAVSNSILWDNVAETGEQIFTGRSLINVIHSTIQTGWNGFDNISEDPGFIQAGFFNELNAWMGGDYHLTFSSTSINSGQNDQITPELLDDRDGRPRILCERIDRGAYESGIGDYNCDLQVDLFDYQQWIACMTGMDYQPYPMGCEAFDFNADLVIDLRDYGDFQNRIGVVLP